PAALAFMGATFAALMPREKPEANHRRGLSDLSKEAAPLTQNHDTRSHVKSTAHFISRSLAA
ncbi:MAG TPA: hypothetical protein VJT12_05485, partial [Methyloceanibacter sp.]|nr:hypothetical protein [Methyloceanibacter sp.]